MALNPNIQAKLRQVLVQVNAAIESGHSTQALRKLEELNTNYPKQRMILSLLGKVNTQMGRHSEAIESFQRAVQIDNKDSNTRFQLAIALQSGGRYEEALVEFERALYYTPNHFLALRHKCSVLTDLNRIDDAHKAWNTLCKKTKDQDLQPNQRLAIAISGARLAPKVRDVQSSIDELQLYINDESCEHSMLVAGTWQLARLHDSLGQNDAAFGLWKQCKELDKGQWDPDAHAKRIDRLIDCWTKQTDIPSSTTDGSRLIFIVGMMRSGTSLIEQMLAQIEHITPGGEMNAISRQVSATEPKDPLISAHARPYPYTASAYTKQSIENMARNAIKVYNQIAQQGSITDKQPFNYAMVPLIAHMFPGCKFIHCMREPMDCLLSNYTQAFSHLHMHTHDLYWLGRYHQDYQRTMDAWKMLPEISMIDLHYEDLVTNSEHESKRVVEFLGFNWDESILGFHNSDRTVRTASRDQVRKPMYTSSVAKYKKYEHHLDDLKRGLGFQG